MDGIEDFGRRRAWLAAVGLLVLPAGVAAPAWAGTTVRVSVASDGTQATPGPSGSLWVAISGDGQRVAFESVARNLSGDLNSLRDVFVHDRGTGATRKVSVDSRGTPGDGASGELGVAISGGGGFVAFESIATNLVAGDTNGTHDVFVRDLGAGKTERVSVGPEGREANDRSQWPKISADGRYVMFWSQASNLVPNDTNNVADVFIRDRRMGTTERVSVGGNGRQANGDSFPVGLSTSGRFVLFNSNATNLAPGGAKGSFVRDRKLGRTKLVSPARAVDVSADGGLIILDSFDALVPGDVNGREDIYVHDRQTGGDRLVSLSGGGDQGNGNSYGAAISADGRSVAFLSDSTNLVQRDSNGLPDVFVRDLRAGTTQRVSVAADGREAKGQSFNPALSARGRVVAFSSQAPNLVPNDTNHNVDVFIRVR